MRLLDAMTFGRNPPANLQAGDERIFAGGDCVCEAVGVRTLEDVAFNPSGELFDARGVLPESFLDARQHARRDLARYARRASEARAAQTRLEGEALWICDRQSHNYHHWLADALPRLEAWLGVHDAARLVLPARVAEQPFVSASLAAYPQVEVVAPPDGPAIAKRLLFVEKASPPGRHHDVLAGRVARRLRQHFAAGVEPSGARLYVSRRLARFRAVANEAEIAPVLERHGLREVVLEAIPFAEQVRLLAGASFLCGPHGAGLTNMMLMERGRAVLELRQPEGPPLCFLELAAASGHGYRYLACEPADPLAHPHAADILVNPEALDLELSQAQQ